MLMLSRRIDEQRPETIRVYVHYENNPALCQLLNSFGIDPQWLASISDTITITPVRIDNPTGLEEEIVIGIDAARHIDIVRSEIDNNRI